MICRYWKFWFDHVNCRFLSISNFCFFFVLRFAFSSTLFNFQVFTRGHKKFMRSQAAVWFLGWFIIIFMRGKRPLAAVWVEEFYGGGFFETFSVIKEKLKFLGFLWRTYFNKYSALRDNAWSHRWKFKFVGRFWGKYDGASHKLSSRELGKKEVAKTCSTSRSVVLKLFWLAAH